jgi:uncharacterized protein (DUF433 family)
MEILAFSADQVLRLTGLSATQLRYWDKTEFFHPEHAYGARAFGRVYSFRDVVALRVIAMLRKEHKLSLQVLRKVGRNLQRHHETPWAALSLYVLGKRVYFREPKSGAMVAAGDVPQLGIEIAMEVVARDVSREAAALRERKPEDFGRIARNRYVMHNSPVVAGTRVPTSAIWNMSQAHYTTAQIIREYPRLTPADIAEAISYETKRARPRRTG